jgi:hypothetical protein
LAIRDHFDEHWTIDPDTGCHNWQRGNSHGYGGLISISGAGKSRIQKYPHVFAYERKHGPIASGLQVCHRCDNPRCVNVEHMFLGTFSDNIKDMHRKGRSANKRPDRWRKHHAEGLQSFRK